ncbi:helix-turn-helix transcriptional regulator [Kribbella sp. NPDC056861]|uniref:helix-turn-helix domain-containing protein n=1 Tax=Kribbella sp. NPDC056861 TaxID=3154857 RepID=UPI003441B6B5
MKERRQELHLTATEVARRADIDPATITRIEAGRISSPRGDSLAAIAKVLDIPVTDFYVCAGLVPEKELPSFNYYLRTKYSNIPEKDRAILEGVFEQITKPYGHDPRGPSNGEDEG